MLPQRAREQFGRPRQARLAQMDLDPTGYAPLRTGINFVDAEIPSGLVNGVNNVFTLQDAPNPPESLVLFSDKAIQVLDVDFTLNLNVITLVVPPATSIGPTWYRR